MLILVSLSVVRIGQNKVTIIQEVDSGYPAFPTNVLKTPLLSGFKGKQIYLPHSIMSDAALTKFRELFRWPWGRYRAGADDSISAIDVSPQSQCVELRPAKYCASILGDLLWTAYTVS